MTHVHFDIAEVEAMFRAMRAQMRGRIETGLSGFPRDVAVATDGVFEAVLQLMLLTPRLRNEGRDDEFIGHVYGAILANVMMNAVGASADPGMAVEIIGRRIDRMLQTLGGAAPEGALVVKDEVVGARGGRA